MAAPQSTPVPKAATQESRPDPNVAAMVARFSHTFPERDFAKAYETMRQKLGSKVEIEDITRKIDGHLSAVALIAIHVAGSSGTNSYEFELISELLEKLRSASYTAQFMMACRMRTMRAQQQAAKDSALDEALADIDEADDERNASSPGAVAAEEADASDDKETKTAVAPKSRSRRHKK